MKVKFSDYVGQTVKARYAKEGNVDGADVPLLFEGEITIYKNEEGDIRFNDDWDDDNWPFDDYFELLTP
jgi:hypothetical protein